MSDPKLEDLLDAVRRSEEALPAAQHRSQRRRAIGILGSPTGPITSPAFPADLLTTECPTAQQTNETIATLRRDILRDMRANEQIQNHLDKLMENVDPSRIEAVQEAVSNADFNTLFTLVIDDHQAVERDLGIVTAERDRYEVQWNEVRTEYNNHLLQNQDLQYRLATELERKAQSEEKLEQLEQLQGQTAIDAQTIQELQGIIIQHTTAIVSLRTEIALIQRELGELEQLQTETQNQLADERQRVVTAHDHDRRAQARIVEMEDNMNNLFSTPRGSRRGSLESVADDNYLQIHSAKDDPPPSFSQLTSSVGFNAMLLTLMWNAGKTTGEQLMTRAHIGKLADSWMVPLLIMASEYTGISIFRLQRTVPTSYLIFLIVALTGAYATGDLPKFQIESIFQYLDIRIARFGTSVISNNVSPALGAAIDTLIDTEEITRRRILDKSTQMIPLLSEVCQVGISFELTKWATIIKASLNMLVDAVGTTTMETRHVVPIAVGVILGSNNAIAITLPIVEKMAFSLTSTLITESMSNENIYNVVQTVAKDFSVVDFSKNLLLAAARVTAPPGTANDDLEGLLRPALTIGAAIFVVNCVTLSLSLRDWLASKTSLRVLRPLLTDRQGNTIDLAGKYSGYLAAIILSCVVVSMLSTSPESTQREVMTWFLEFGLKMGITSYALQQVGSRL